MSCIANGSHQPTLFHLMDLIKPDDHLLGANMSIAGGLHNALERGVKVGCRTIQIFTKNTNQWKGRPLKHADIENYKICQQESRISPVVAHGSYLINLCATDRAILRKSRTAFKEELERCEMLAIPNLVFHPGAHLGAGLKDGIERIAESLNLVHGQTSGHHVKTTIECTAGQGTNIGYRFEHLRAIIDLTEDTSRMAACLDTCHLYAAGYEINTEEGYEGTIREFDDIVGIDRLTVFHCNDSKRERGSRVDRHEHIGKGRIGPMGFWLLMNDLRFVQIPKILETYKGEDMKEDVINLRRLRSYVGLRREKLFRRRT